MAAMNKLRTEMAQRFLDALNQEQIPWKACWQQALPQNAVSGKPYHGVNAMYLSYFAMAMGYQDPRWCTYNQAQEKGWQVRKGEKSSMVEYWAYYDLKQKKLLSWAETRRLLKDDPDYKKNLQLSSRCYRVFNAEQIDGIPPYSLKQTDIGQLRSKRDTLLQNMALSYREEGIRAYYSPGTDTVTLPPEASFDDTYSYMSTFLHEAAHASGHPARLNRNIGGMFGSDEYAKEELRAEIASAFAAQALGLRLTDRQLQYHMDQHSAYLQSWTSRLKDAPEELFRAIRAAEEISDYLIEQGEFLQEQEAEVPVFFAKIVHVGLGCDEIVSFYDNAEKYYQELRYQQAHASPNYGRELTRQEFLTDVSKALLTQGHYMALGTALDGDYTAEIRAFMAANPPTVEVHPWMAMENQKVEAVHRWESRQMTLMPEGLSVVADGHTGQLFIQPGMQQTMEQRYLNFCADSPDVKSYREQVQAVFEYERFHNLPENECMTKWYPEEHVSVAKPWYREYGTQRIPISEDMIGRRYREIQKEASLTVTDTQREAVFWKMKNYLDRGGDIAELQYENEPDLDYGP